jgi:hypothetical protein
MTMGRFPLRRKSTRIKTVAGLPPLAFMVERRRPISRLKNIALQEGRHIAQQHLLLSFNRRQAIHIATWTAMKSMYRHEANSMLSTYISLEATRCLSTSQSRQECHSVSLDRANCIKAAWDEKQPCHENWMRLWHGRHILANQIAEGRSPNVVYGRGFTISLCA